MHHQIKKSSMSKIELVMPKMGESIMEATILKWLKKEGDAVEIDEPILEIATDKVDSDVPAPEAGIMGEILYPEGETVEVGKIIAYIHTEGSEAEASPSATPAIEPKVVEKVMEPLTQAVPVAETVATVVAAKKPASSNGQGRFYSPLVLNMARAEGISMETLENIPGTGKGGRVTKKDMLQFIKNGAPTTARTTAPTPAVQPSSKPSVSTPKSKPAPAVKTQTSGNVEIVEMDRMRRLIADHMVMSKQTSPHVTSFVEADVTNMVNWRNKVKGDFLKREGQKITFTPLLIEACVKAIRDFPRINSSVDGYNVILKKDINIGMAAALPSGNLIVPVIKNADQMNLLGLTKTVNGLVYKARNNKLAPDDIQGGTFTLTNVGTFGNVMGTPIINQPQVAILATGAIKKKPAVLETEHGDVIAIRHMMFLSLSYDHRTIDGALGGSFLRRVADYLEAFDGERTV